MNAEMTEKKEEEEQPGRILDTEDRRQEKLSPWLREAVDL